MVTELLIARATALGGVFSTADARASGLDANQLRGLLRLGAVRRVGPRAFVLASAQESATTPERRHRLETLAILRSFDNRVAASHHSALALHGLPFWDVDPEVVHVCRVRGRSGRVRGRLHIHESVSASSLRVSPTRGTVVTSPAVAAIGTAIVDGFEAGLVAMDAALHRGLTTPGELEQVLQAMRCSPGITAARRALAAADGRSESVGESRLRLVLSTIPGLPEVEPQFTVVDPQGTVLARADFRVGRRVLVEFDGRLKYRAAASWSQAEAEDVVWREKQREDRLRALGYVVVRVVWAELSQPLAIVHRVLAAVHLAETMRNP